MAVTKSQEISLSIVNRELLWLVGACGKLRFHANASTIPGTLIQGLTEREAGACVVARDIEDQTRLQNVNEPCDERRKCEPTRGVYPFRQRQGAVTHKPISEDNLIVFRRHRRER